MNDRFFQVLMVCIFAFFLVLPVFAEDVPALSKGLSSDQSQELDAEDQPTLPSGLGIEPADTNDLSTEPSLPSGLEIAPALTERMIKS